MQHIPVMDRELIRDTVINTNYSPDMTYRKTYIKWTIPEISCVDARYSAAIISIFVSNSWWQVRTANNGGVQTLQKYEPFEAITQDLTIYTYINSEVVLETDPERTFISFSYSSSVPQSYSCQMTLTQYDIYEKGAAAYSVTMDQPILHQHAQLVTRKISSTVVDILSVFRTHSYSYAPVAEMIRYDTLENVIIKRKGLNEICEIGFYFNYEDDTKTSLAYVGNVGLL